MFIHDAPVTVAAGSNAPIVTWRIVLCDNKGHYVSLLDGIASDIRLEYMMNRPAMLTFTVPSEDPRVNILMQDGDPYLAIGRRSVKAYRKLGEGAGNWELKFAGRIWTLEDQGDGDTVKTSVVCFDPMKILEKRVCRNGVGKYWPKAVQFWDDEDAVDDDDGTSGAHIIRKLILRTKRWGGGNPGTPGLAESAPVHIDVGGKWERTPGISISFDQEYVMDAIVRITDTFTCDLVPKYLDVFNGVFLRLGARRRRGRNRQGSVSFVYAYTPYSAMEYNRVQTMDAMANYVHLMGKTSKNPVTITSENLESQEDYLIMESVETVPGVEQEEALQLLADMLVALRANPRDLVSIVPTPEESPVPWLHFWLGDTVTIRAATAQTQVQPFAVTRQLLPESVARVYGVKLTIDNDFGEYISELVCSPQDMA